MHKESFTIYDRLINGIPAAARIGQCVCGIHWIAIRSDAGVGLSMAPVEGERRSDAAGTIAGRRLKEVAGWAKSWNALEAAIGVAAINSWYNAPSTLESAFGPIAALTSETSVFAEIGPVIEGKKVTVIGHFPDLDLIAPVCSLSILERRPEPGDFPDPACEFILPHQDFVFMTGVTFINKTLPRLLELSRTARIVLVGPSVPLSPIFFDYGVDRLAGTVVMEEEAVFKHVMEGGDKSIFNSGAKRIRLDKSRCNQKNLTKGTSGERKEKP
jgi:uncharacterized protein (DUF4213/DUF364 family)